MKVSFYFLSEVMYVISAMIIRHIINSKVIFRSIEGIRQIHTKNQYEKKMLFFP